MSYQLWSFHGGLHLPEHKSESNQTPIKQLPLAQKLMVPCQQHIGEEAEPIVQVGDRVDKGQPLTFSTAYVTAPIHAPTSGRVLDIGEYPIAHPSGLKANCIVIEPDGEDRWSTELPAPIEDYEQCSPAELRQRIRDAGIVGLGGAGFPSAVKLNPGPDTPIELLILNGAECEPYITCDDRLMRERAEEIITGLMILKHTLQAKTCIIGVEDNKPEAIAALRDALVNSSMLPFIRLQAIPTIYPTGGEKQLIKVLTGKEVRSHGLPAELGIVCHNVATAASIYQAVIHGRPLISRVVTVAGKGIKNPGNFEVPFGTPIHHVVEQAGGYTEHAERLILGGPMMGVALPDDERPLIKTGNCVLVTNLEELPPRDQPLPCIRCGECARHCPASLLPQQLYWHARSKNFDLIQEYNLFDCIECGCCSHVCPSHIPLVQYYRYAKNEIWAQERDSQDADRARRRHEAKEARKEREKAERKAKAAAAAAKKKAEAAKKAAGSKEPEDSKQAMIQAALERAKKKKEALKAEQTAE